MGLVVIVLLLHLVICSCLLGFGLGVVFKLWLVVCCFVCCLIAVALLVDNSVVMLLNFYLLLQFVFGLVVWLFGVVLFLLFLLCLVSCLFDLIIYRLVCVIAWHNLLLFWSSAVDVCV